MKAKLVTYEHAENGISLFVVPETDAELELLRGLWKHGTMKKCNGVEQQGEGFAIQWKMQSEPETGR